MKKIFNTIISLLCVISFSSCSDFLDVVPTGVVIPNTVEHYDQMLNGIVVTTIGVNDMYMDPDTWMDGNDATYVWAERAYTGSQQDDTYQNHYRNIYTANTILANIDNAPLGGAIEETRIRAKRDAYVLRAMFYFRLVNMYSPHYSAENASKVAVPIILDASGLDVKLPSSTVGEVYEQILSDLNSALDMLKDEKPAPFSVRGSNLAVKAMLAKVSLYMGDFTSAKRWADEALKVYPTLNDYTKCTDVDDFIKFNYADPDVILYGGGLCAGFYYSLCFSPQLSALFDKENDIRFKFFASATDFYGEAVPEGIYEHNNDRETNSICGTPDLYLIRAECNALEGNIEAAMKDIDLLRKNRILPAGYSAFYPGNMPASKDEALKIISEERRRETAMSGENLWTQKRYHAQGRKVPTYTRVDLNGQVVATLEPGSSGYWIGFSQALMDKNPNIKWNK